MRKFLGIFLIAMFGVLLAGGAAFAQGEVKTTFINIYKVDYQTEDYTISVGLKGKVWGYIYGTLNFEPDETKDDLKIQGGITYLFPRNVLFFKFYGGIGRALFRDNGFDYDYILLGTHFLYFFSEIVYPWKRGEDPFYRYGLSFNY